MCVVCCVLCVCVLCVVCCVCVCMCVVCVCVRERESKEINTEVLKGAGQDHRLWRQSLAVTGTLDTRNGR